MKWHETARLIGLSVSGWRARAMSYLESEGFAFCVDFGTENAVEKARAHWIQRKRGKPAGRTA